MNHRLKSVLMIMLFWAGATVAAPAAPSMAADAQLNDDQLARIQNGDILVQLGQSEQQPRGSVEAVVWIAAPAEAIWRIMTDCDAAPEFIPVLKRAAFWNPAMIGRSSATT